MTKSQLIVVVAELNAISRASAERIVNAMFEEMSQTLIRGERIEFRGFGSFHVRKYKPYVGRNPRTGESVSVPIRRRVRFRMSERMFDRLNRQL
jgi:integration host factor subunit beta